MQPLENLKGLGPRRLAALRAIGISTMTDLLLTLPIRYEDTQTVTPIARIVPGENCCVEVFPEKKASVSWYKGKCLVTQRFTDPSGSIEAVWFNQSWMQSAFQPGDEILLYGRADYDKRGRLRLLSPSRVTERAILPVYRANRAFPAKTMRALIRQALEELESCCPESLPRSVRTRYGLCERNFALRQVHFPDTKENLDIALRRLVFENTLLYQTAASYLRASRREGIRLDVPDGAAEEFWKTLPFAPTGAQKRVLDEIIGDLKSPYAMGRIVQGDVGSGKTAVAFGAMLACVRCGHQAVLMAPTEILARQHLESAVKTLPGDVKCGLLIGGMRSAQRREALEKIASGEWQIVIGTHALLSEPVRYARLGLVVTDEQHRFGVKQRRMLSKKSSETVNELVMSATPIPRTLALILFGDLDISVLDELPPGRTPVRTRIVPDEKREGLYRYIIDQARKGYQTYVVCPLVEESETVDAQSAQTVYGMLCAGPLRELRVALTYGEQKPEEKAEVLAAFSRGEIDVLVATTVIEVGVNVPNATTMVIENAGRFGLSQLHQLRGRVGRGSAESWCFLMDRSNDRLRALCETNDGFKIAQRDLELRGPGEFLGTRQHGSCAIPGIAFGSDMKLLEETTDCLRYLKTPGHGEEWEMVRASAMRLYASLVDEIAMN